MKLFGFIYLLLLLNVYVSISQTQTNDNLIITGYLSFNGEYINNLKSIKELKSNVGVGITEASLLATYKANQDISIFAVFTFKPYQGLNSSFTELSGSYHFLEELNVKVGRFILPIQPINLQYYAPMNVGIALPSFITNHKLFPLNLNGADIFGEIELNKNFNLSYNLIAGQYEKIEQTKDGVLGFFGREGVFMSDSLEEVTKRLKTSDSLSFIDKPNFFGTGSRIALNYRDDNSIGFAYFYGKEKIETINKLGILKKTDIDLFSYGGDISLNVLDFQIKSSLWFGNETPADTTLVNTKSFSIFDVELAYPITDIITPYLKYESINGMAKEDRVRGIVGINIRPIYEINFKTEYIRYMQDFIEDFDVFHFSIIYSF